MSRGGRTMCLGDGDNVSRGWRTMCLDEGGQCV